MHFIPGDVYHVYNRGNEKKPIFFNEGNYRYFLSKIRKEWIPLCDILCYCLMPNHFHFMVIPNASGCELLTLNGKISDLQKLSKTIGKSLSSYTIAINKQNHSTGNLFQKKTKAKTLMTSEYIMNCFEYIHCNPLKAKLSKELSEWPFSSFQEYYHSKTDLLCNRTLAIKTLLIDQEYFKNIKCRDVDEDNLRYLF